MDGDKSRDTFLNEYDCVYVCVCTASINVKVYGHNSNCQIEIIDLF